MTSAKTRKQVAMRLYPEMAAGGAVYGHVGVEQYAGASVAAWRAAAFVDRLTPPRMAPTLMVFARKLGTSRDEA